jgi:hypothetical protein
MTEDLDDMAKNPLRVAAALFTLLVGIGLCVVVVGAPIWYLMQ